MLQINKWECHVISNEIWIQCTKKKIRGKFFICPNLEVYGKESLYKIIGPMKIFGE